MSGVVRIRGLPYSARADDIIEFFKGPNGRSNGEAFIELESDDELAKATSHHNEHMGRRYIEVFRSSRDELDNAMGRENRHSYHRKEYVVRLRGLPYDTEKKEIYAFFNGLEIAPNGIGLLVDHMGRCTGEAYVQFTSAEMLARAKEKHMEKIGHRYIEIFESSMSEANATIQRQMEANRRSGVGPMMGRSGRDPYNGGGAGYYGPPKGGYGPPPMGHGYGRGPPSGRPGPYARPMPPNHPGGYGSPPRGMGGPSPKAPSYASMTNPEPEDPQSMTGHSIRLRGLPYSATNEDIDRFLSPLQPVNIRIRMNSNGRPTGEAVVDFASHDEAKEAMKKDREKIGSRYIELFLVSTPMGNSSRMVPGGPPYGRPYGPPGSPPYGGGPGRMPMNDGYGGGDYGAMRGPNDMNYDGYYNGSEGMGMEGDGYPDYRSGYRQPNYHWS